MDWKAPTCPKNSCQQGLLDIAIDHLPRLTFEEKFAHGLPNTHLSQTINKVSCNNVEDLLATAEKELDKIQELAYLKENEETRFGGSVRLEHVNYRYGLDDGIETLCLALNQWTGVVTVNSCSGLHAGASSRWDADMP